ncbi:hypothetical protein HPB52_012669 [Rhipicephalus sanguineus]|uniref:Uncharacterized protein n=1 Tax=Rhipicephalus sanguineus TaxID=34632 RepID=A0A9D4SSK2_RHISA|nr:hypothetical protein HPB52_012669 [Rhipicephalus sanguineus]
MVPAEDVLRGVCGAADQIMVSIKTPLKRNRLGGFLRRNSMERLYAEREEPSLGTFAERFDVDKIFDRGGAEHFRLPCAATTPTAMKNNQVCPLNDYLPICNELLFDVGMELREQRGCSLSLVCFQLSAAEVVPPRDADLCRANTFLRWLLRTHVCITDLVLKGKWVTAHSQVFLEELPENCRLRNLNVEFSFGEIEQAHFATLLPRLRCLEELKCYMSPTSDTLLAAISLLLRNTMCLTSLVFYARFENCQPPQQFIDALSANTTLKSLEMWENWNTDEPPGTLGEYVSSNQLLTSLSLFGEETDREELLLEEALVPNTTISALVISSSDNLVYNDHFAATIGFSRCITRLFYVTSKPEWNPTGFVVRLSETIDGNFNLLNVDLCNAKVDAEAKHCLFTIRETTRRNSGLVERAAAFKLTAPLDWYTANALEKVSRRPTLVRELAEKEGMAADEVASTIRSRLRSVEGLHDFMRLTGVVKEHVTCARPVDRRGVQLQDLNAYCWRIVRRYLSFDDVKRLTVAMSDNSTPG